jgi:hypothetical protein
MLLGFKPPEAAVQFEENVLSYFFCCSAVPQNPVRDGEDPRLVTLHEVSEWVRHGIQWDLPPRLYPHIRKNARLVMRNLRKFEFILGAERLWRFRPLLIWRRR